MPKQAEPAPAEDFTWWYIMLGLLFAGLAVAVFWLLKSRKTEQTVPAKLVQPKKTQKQVKSEPLDFDKEIEWLRKNQKLVNRNHKAKSRKTVGANNAPKKLKAINIDSEAGTMPQVDDSPDSLPVFFINRLEYARPFNALAISNDESLLNAIEQVYEEFEEDEEIRELSVKILAMFKTRNSIEALSQVALYDISSNLRSKSVSILADYDHESVFETILLACADPSREVRAAAARGLFRLSFDRADAWVRIAESNDEFRMRQAARAAIEGDLVTRSFDRLVHSDRKNVYEAFALVALLIKAGEAEIIFDTLKKQQNINTCKAILHVIKIVKEPNILEELYELSENAALSEEIKREIREIIKDLDLVQA